VVKATVQKTFREVEKIVKESVEEKTAVQLTMDYKTARQLRHLMSLIYTIPQAVAGYPTAAATNQQRPERETNDLLYAIYSALRDAGVEK